MLKLKKIRFFNIITSISIIGIVGSSIAFSFLNNSNLTSSSNNSSGDDLSNSKSKQASGDETSTNNANEEILVPSRIKISRPKQVGTTSSYLPTFSNGSVNKFSFTLNRSTSKPAVSFANSYFSNPFILDKPNSNIPLNQDKSVGEFSSNFFIGFQKYNNGSLTNEGNYGSTISQRYENETGDNFISNVTISNLENLYLNPNEIAIFSIESSGVNKLLDNQISLLKMYEPLVGNEVKNWNITSSNNKIDNTNFYYNLIIQNNGSNYDFYVPEESQKVNLYYNNQNGVMAAPISDYTASEYIAYLKSNQTELEKFRIDSSNSLSSNEDFNIILRPDDKNGVVSIDVIVKNFLDVQFSGNGFIYNIEPTKTFKDVITFQGFMPDVSTELDFRNVIDLENSFDPNTLANSFIIPDVSNKGFGLSVNTAQLFGINKNLERFIYNWPYNTGVNNDLYNPTFPFDEKRSIKLFDFSNFGNGDNASINLIEKNWSNILINGQGDSNFYASISNFNNSNTLNDSMYNFLEPNDSEQWLSLSSWKNYNHYVLNEAYTNFQPIDYKTAMISQPFVVSDKQIYYSTIKPNVGTTATISNNSPVAINLKIRNDNLLSNSELNTLTLSNGKGDGSYPINMDFLTGNYGSYKSTQNNKAYEYLTGVISQVNGVGYWCSPKNDTYITVEPNGGFSRESISSYLASNFLANNFMNQKIKLRINGGIANTLSDMKIKAYADDINGVINVSIIPGIGVESDIIKGNVDDYNNSINEYKFKQLEPIKFKIEGFSKKDSFLNTYMSNDTIETNQLPFFNPNTYITFGVNDYLLSSQSVSKYVVDRKNLIAANIVQNCLNNVYDLETKKPLIAIEGGNATNALLSQINSVDISIPENSQNGYNYLNVKFKLKGVVINNKLSNDYVDYEFKLMFTKPEKISTTINPRINLVYSLENYPEIDCNQIKYLLEKNKDEFFSFLLFGYKNINDHLNNVENNDNNYVELNKSAFFKLPTKQLNGQEIDYSFKDIPVKRNELIFGYPENYSDAYTNMSDLGLYATDDELSPTNWSISNISYNEKSISFSLGLKYFVNSKGIIEYRENYQNYNSEFLGKSVDNATTYLSQSSFLSPDSEYLASQFFESYKNNGFASNQLLVDVGNILLKSIYELPNDANNLDNLVIISDSVIVNNIEGTIQFDLGLKKAKIEGADYNWNGADQSTLFNVGTVTISGFKKVFPTILLDNFEAISFISVDGLNVSPSSLYASDVANNEALLKQLILNDGLKNASSSSSISFKNILNNVVVDNLEGQIIINNPNPDDDNCQINVSYYYGSNGQLNTGTYNFFRGKSKIVISGFKKAKATSLSSNSYDINSTESILSYNEDKAINLINSLLENLPTNFNKNDDIFIDNFEKHLDTNIITFRVYLRYGIRKDGQIIKVDKDVNDTSLMIDLGDFSIINFNSKYQDTLAVESGVSIVSLNKYIASNYINFNVEDNGLFIFNTDANSINIKKTIISRIISSIGSSYSLINNAPDLTTSDIDLKIEQVDNTTGNITFFVFVSKYYENGELITISSPTKNIGRINISGFKVLPSDETTLASHDYAVNGEENTDSIDQQRIKKIVFDNSSSIFKNLPNNPSFVQSENNENDNPNFNESNINIDSGYTLLNGQVSINDIKLTSYYELTSDERKGKVVWVENGSKSFGQLNLQGFKNWANTSISNRVDISKNDSLSSKTSGEIVRDNILLNQVKTFVWENAIINKSKTSTIQNLIFNSIDHNNLKGEIIFDVSLNNYIDNGKEPSEGEILSKTLDAKITVIGFKTASPTTTDLRIIVSNPYDSMFPYELTEEQIKTLILEYSSNVPNSMTINDISYSRAIINNFDGTITIVGLRYLRNYYDNNANLSNTPSSPSPNITITNFKWTKTSTSIKSQYDINSSLLPFEYINNNNFNYLINQLIINNLIDGAPTGLSENDLVITNIVDNNIAGKISMTIGLKKYINSSGILVDCTKDPSYEYLQKDVEIVNFSTISPTSILDNLFIDNKSMVSPSKFILESNYKDVIKTLIISKGIKGKWQSLSENSIDIVSATPKNVSGSLSVNVLLNEWIDSSGLYHSKKKDGESFIPLEQTIIINGFKQVKTTFISEIPTSCNFDKIPEKVTNDEIKKFIFDYLVVNKTSEMTIDNIEIVASSRVNNNKLGRIELNAFMNGNYYDDNGNFSNVGNNSKQFKVVLLTRNTASPTILTPTYSISGITDFEKYTSYDFVKAKTLEEKLEKEKTIINLIKTKGLFKYLPSDYGYEFNWLSSNQSSESDISIVSNIVDNGEELLGIPTNGGLLIKVKLNKYMNDTNAEYSSIENNDPPKIFETLLTGFKTVENGTTINEKVNIVGYEDKLASDYVTNLSSNSIIAKFILSEESNVIINWPKDKRIPDNLSISSLVSDNINGKIIATFKIKNFVDGNGLPYENWSNDYVVEISGYKKIKPTTLNDVNYNISGQIGEELANIINKDQNFNVSSNLTFDEINIAELSKNKNFNQIISFILYDSIKKNGLESIILNPTEKVINLFNNSFDYTSFVNCIRSFNFLFDYTNGKISFEIKLLSYFSSFDGTLIENSVPLIGNVVLSGFQSVKTTSIKSFVESSTLSDILASDWESSEINLRRFIINNLNLFIQNPSYNTTINDIDILDDSIVSNNKQGYISFTLELTNYFGRDGNYHVNDGTKLSQKIVLSGFKVITGGTSMRTIIDINKDQIFGVNNIEQLNPNLINDVLYNFRNGNSLIEPIFTNLPDDFQKENIIVSNESEWTISYCNGTVIVPINLSYYYNSDGSPEYGNLSFNLVLNGFNKVNDITKTAESIDISIYPSISSFTARDIQPSDIQYLANSDQNFLKALFNENIANKTKCNLPENFQPITDMRDFSFEEFDPSQPNSRILTFKYNNYFGLNQQSKIEIIDNKNDYDNWMTAKIVLSGFKSIKETKYKNLLWDISNTNASRLYTGNITANQLSQFANEVIKDNVDNLLYDSDGVTPLTSIVVNDITKRNGSTGEISAKISMKNYVNSNLETIKEEGNTVEVVFKGFHAKDTTLASQSTEIDASDIKYIPSVYLKTSSNLIDELNKERVSGKSYLDIILGSSALTGANKTEVVDIIGVDSDKSIFDRNQPGKVRINDKYGTLEFKIKVVNTFTEDGKIMSDPTILKDKSGKDAIIKLRINTGKETKLNSQLRINSSVLGLNNTSANLFTFDTNEITDYIVDNIDNFITLGDDGLTKQEISTQKISIDLNSKDINEKSGIINYKISFSEWWSFISNDSIKRNSLYYENCTNDSVILYKNDEKVTNLSFTGFTKVDKQKDNMLTYFIIGGASLIGLLIIITVVGLLFKNRLWTFK